MHDDTAAERDDVAPYMPIDGRVAIGHEHVAGDTAIDADIAGTDIDVVVDNPIDPRGSIDRDHGTVHRLVSSNDDITADADAPVAAGSSACLRSGRCDKCCTDHERNRDKNA